MTQLTRRGLLATAAIGALVAPRAMAARPGFIGAAEIAERGFVYGLPIVMNYAVMYEYAVDRSSPNYKAPFNTLVNEARVYTYKDTAMPTPNSDTPYSLCFVDLRAEPVVFSVPAVPRERYYAVMLTDANTYNFGYVGTRATGTEAGSYMVAGPTWKGETPKGVKKVFRATSQFAAILFRTQLFGPDDMDNVRKVQAGYSVRTLSAFAGTAPPPAMPLPDFPKVNTELAKTNFFDYVDFMLQFIPVRPEDREIRGQLARIGVGPGKTFAFADLSLEDKAEVGIGMKAGDWKVDRYLKDAGVVQNGWHVSSMFGDATFYKGDWMKRAAAARAGIYGNDAIEAMYPMARTDATGEEINTAKHKYTLTFPKGRLPPVNAFWSVTMYDGKTQLLIENPINRYLINSPMLPGLKTGADGSLTLYIQKDSPGKDLESNWLPAPNGPAYIVMRLYYPRVEQPSILPVGHGSWKPPGFVRVG